MDDLKDVVRAALDIADTETVKDQIHAAVIDRLRELDETVKIETTNYFNHTFVPDFVLSWPEAGRKDAREVFLRWNLESAQAARDVQALGGQGPVLLSLDTQDSSPEVLDIARVEAIDAPRMLVTGVEALDLVSAADGPRQTAGSPLRSLVRANLVRGGKGVVDSATARTLAPQELETDAAAADEEAALSTFEDAVVDHFLPDAANRLNRASRLIRMSLSPDATELGDFLGLGPDDEEQGRLGKAEVLALLPYLLGRPNTTRDFWAYMGRLVELTDIESLWAQLGGVDLTPFVSSNTGGWRAFRSSLNASEEWTEGETPPDGWRMHARMLSLSVGPWRLHVASDGRKLKAGEADRSAVAWDSLTDALRTKTVHSVRLEGIDRSVELVRTSAINLRDDIRTVEGSLADRYFVPSITVSSESSETTDAVQVDFQRSLVQAVGSSASITEHALAAFDLLGRNNPVPPAAVRAFLDVSDPLPPSGPSGPSGPPPVEPTSPLPAAPAVSSEPGPPSTMPDVRPRISLGPGEPRPTFRLRPPAIEAPASADAFAEAYTVRESARNDHPEVPAEQYEGEIAAE